MKNTAIRHEIGKRPNQEDTYLVYQANEIKTEEQAKTFLKAFHTSTLECTKDQNAGSCGISTVYIPQTQQVVWSNLGDSQATVFVYRQNKKEVESQVLNKLHKAHYNYKFGGNYISDAEGNGLAVTRAYGDQGFQENNQFSTEIDLGTLDVSALNLADGDRAFLMTSCDGYFEWDGALYDYNKAILTLLNQTPSARAEQVLDTCRKIW